MNFPFDDFNVSLSCRTPAPTNYSHIFNPHESCSYCSNPHHQVENCPSFEQVENCPSFEQFFNFSYKQMNTSFSSLGFESNSNFYNPNWSNYSNFSWQAHATRNYTPQVDELHNPEYPQFDNQFSLEDALNVFRKIVNQGVKEL